MSKFKVGDKVRVKPTPQGIADQDFAIDMLEYVGKTFEISSLDRQYYILNIGDETDWKWKENWLQPVINKGPAEEHIYKAIQHRTRRIYLNEEMQMYIEEHFPEIDRDDMVDITEYRSFQLNNTWEDKE